MPQFAVQPAQPFDVDQPAPAAGDPTRAAIAQPEVVTLAEGDVAWAASPARDLHARLIESFAPVLPRPDVVLSPRQRTLILVGSTALLWAAIGGVALALLA